MYARNFGSHPFNGTESTRLNSTNTNQLLARRKLSDSFDLFLGSLILRTRIKFSLMPLLSKVDFPTSFSSSKRYLMNMIFGIQRTVWL